MANKMTRAAFINAVADTSNIDVGVVQEVIAGCEEILLERLKNEQEVQPFYGFIFKPQKLKDGEYLNPRTLDTVEVHGRKTVYVTPTKVFKDKLNERR